MADDGLVSEGRPPPAAFAAGAASRPAEPEEMPRVRFTRGRVVAFGVFVVSAVAFLYFVLPKIAGEHGLKDTWNKIETGDPWWLGVAAGSEILSFLGYVVLFRTVFVRGASRIDWRESYQITMAGLAATRLFAAAGAGGVALTAWALRRSGMERRIVACRMVAFMVLLYSVYMGALVLDGIGLRVGLLAGPHPLAITVVPAVFGACVIALSLAVSLVPEDLQRRLAGWAEGRGRLARLAQRVATVPAAAASGVRTAIALVRRREAGVLGAVAWWAFDVAVLWACYRAFGGAPPVAVVVMAYFVGMIANTLPLPGGIGGVEGGMIGALAAFGQDVDVAVVAVLSYRAFSFWLPTLPGAVAYVQLLRTVRGWGAAQPVRG